MKAPPINDGLGKRGKEREGKEANREKYPEVKIQK